LPLKQEELFINGHSIETRIYAENPLKNFMPDTGKLQLYQYPKTNSELRVETGVQEGNSGL
jgi:3-methylcrotonyl-CoA carboxylase alpha subunit